MCAMQFSRARRLSSATNLVPRRELAVGCLDHLLVGGAVRPPAAIGFEIHRAELPLLARVLDAGAKAALLLLLADVEEILDQLDARAHQLALEAGADSQEALGRWAT